MLAPPMPADPSPTPSPENPGPPWKLAAAAGALLGLTAMVFFTLGTVAQLLDIASGLWITQLVVFALPAILFARAANTSARSFLRWDVPLGGPTLALVLLASAANYFVAAGGMGLCTQLLPESWQFADAARVLAAEEGGRLSLILFAVVVLAPFCEETLFRGALQRSLVNSLGPWPGIALTALAFSALHADPIGFLPRMELGLLFGWLAWRTGSLAAPILAHAVNNGAATFLFYLAGDSASTALEPERDAPMLLLLGVMVAGAVVLLPTLRVLDRLAPRPSAENPQRLDPTQPIGLRPDSPELTALGVLLLVGMGAFLIFLVTNG